MSDKKNLNSESNDYRAEMEELARIFKEELDKTIEEAEENDENIEDLEVEGYNPRTVSVEGVEAPKPLSEDELCECCGERPRGTEKNPNSPFCSDCEAILEKYPYDWKGALATIIVAFITLVAIVSFVGNTPIFSYTIEGDKAYNNGEYHTAVRKYTKAISHMSEEDIKSFLNVHEKRIFANYALLDMDAVVSDAGTYFSKTALKMPMYKDVAEIEDEIVGMQATVIAIQNTLSQFEDVTEKNYEDVIKALDKMSGVKIYVSGSNYNLETDEGFVPTGKEDVYVCDDAWIDMYKYSAAQYVGKDEKIIVEYLASASEKSEYLSSLVNPLLAATYVGIGEYEKAENLLDDIKNANAEGIDYHMVQSMLYRYRDKDYQKGISVCVDGLNMLSRIPDGSDLIPQLGYILSMQKTLNYIMLKDYDSAYDSAHECYAYQTETYSVSAQVRDLYAMLALEVGDTETYTTLKEEIEEYGEDAIGFSEDVKKYREGKITLQELAMSGGYDLI